MSDFVTVARVEEVPDGGMKAAELDGESIVLIRQGESFYALEDRCSHEEFPLSSGDYAAGELTCVLHGARFDVTSGAPRSLPAVKPVKTYEVRVEGDEIQVRAGG